MELNDALALKTSLELNLNNKDIDQKRRRKGDGREQNNTNQGAITGIGRQPG